MTENKLNKEKLENKNSNFSNDLKEKIINTENNLENGQNKCPKCGATDISLNTKTGKLRCNFCRHEFEPIKLAKMEKDISKLKGKVVGSGATNIKKDSLDIVTLKCTSCGALVVVDTNQVLTSRCHWCRNTLSINEQIPNGSVPDTVLPFQITKTEAKSEIEKFVFKRKFFANPNFKNEFTTENIMGVYLPYMIVDVNSHAKLIGQGEHEVRSYTEEIGDRRETYYDADLYNVEREFDLTIEGLTVESSKDKLDKTNARTNNIINAIMPFDTENCLEWNANYLKDYTMEKRDTDINDLETLVNTQAKDISKFAANKSVEFYDRGVRWDKENLDVIGEQWKSACLPVWLYSYYEKDKNILHYVCVNARTKKTMGSVPINKTKLFIISILVEIIGIILMLVLKNDDDYWPYLFLASGFVYYFVIYNRYRNSGARHKYETETKTNITNLVKTDNFVKHEKRLSNSSMTGANNKMVSGATVNVIDQINQKLNK